MVQCVVILDISYGGQQQHMTPGLGIALVRFPLVEPQVDYTPIQCRLTFVIVMMGAVTSGCPNGLSILVKNK